MRFSTGLLITCNIVIPQLMWWKQSPDECAGAFCNFTGREHWHVAGAIHHCGDEFASRFFALVVGNVLPDSMGLGNFRGHNWIISDAAIFVHSIFAGDFDFRNARLVEETSEENKAT